MRDRLGIGCGLVLLALAGGFAWLTRHPETPWLDRAAGWPAVGPLAARFRDAWRPPPPLPPPAPPEPPEIEVITIWMGSGRSSPKRAAPVPAARDRSPATIAAPLLAASVEPEDRRVEPPRPLPARPADPERLARAEAAIGAALYRDRLGPYGYVGDFAPPERWRALADALDAAYAERTGLAPAGAPAETVVALADPERYRALERLEPRLAGLEAGGHAVSGLAVVRADPASPGIAEATLVHELAHLVGRRALGPALPAWLDEGLAEDLAWTPFDEGAARFRWGELGGSLHREGMRVELDGALAGLVHVVDELGAGRLPTVAALVDRDWQAFVSGADAPLRYAEAMLFVRFLLDGGDTGRAAAFRGYLAGIAAGGAADRAALEAALGAPLEALDPAFRVFLAAKKATVVDPAIAALALPGEHVVR